MGSCKICEEKAGLFCNAHRECQDDYARHIASLMESGHFKDAATASHKAVDLAIPLSVYGNICLSTIYFTAICNATESEAQHPPDALKIQFHGMEEQLRLGNPSLYSYLYEEPTAEELQYDSHRRGCTLETLECTYAQARDKAELHTLAALKAAKPFGKEFRERLATIRMMDEMYGPTGDEEESVLAFASAVAYEPEESLILEEMIQLKGVTSLILKGAPDKITGSEATILIKKIASGLAGGGRRVFPVSDAASETDINRWLNNPDMDSTKLLTNTMVISAAADTPVPTKMMVKILRNLFGEEYERYYGIAEENLRQKNGKMAQL